MNVFIGNFGAGGWSRRSITGRRRCVAISVRAVTNLNRCEPRTGRAAILYDLAFITLNGPDIVIGVDDNAVEVMSGLRVNAPGGLVGGASGAFVSHTTVPFGCDLMTLPAPVLEAEVSYSPEKISPFLSTPIPRELKCSVAGSGAS